MRNTALLFANSRTQLGRDAALRLARAARRVIAMSRGTVTTFDMHNKPPDDAILLAHLVGPTGNLRAPCLRKGKMLLVGFDEGEYERRLARKQ